MIEDINPNYNTQRPDLKLKEYGRNIQMLVEYIEGIDDLEKRTKMSYTLINLMKQLNPNVNAGSDTNQRIWDHLYVMSDFQLDIESPYPKPDKGVLYKKPDRMPYRTDSMRFRHYGRNVEMLIGKAVEETDEDLQYKAFANIMRLMKGFAASWNQESADETVIMQDIEDLANGQVDMLKVLERYPFLVDKRVYNDIINNYERRRSSKRGRR